MVLSITDLSGVGLHDLLKTVLMNIVYNHTVGESFNGAANMKSKFLHLQRQISHMLNLLSY